jgi:hypothetical protein
MWILERGRQNSKLSHSILGGQAGRKFWASVLFHLVPSYHGFAVDERDIITSLLARRHHFRFDDCV